ncbi:MAG TPA: UDP-2,3-diacylglucosamine diphosphatase LpxI [Hyphomicrobiaceae bacterium]|nr:UDP-2,3-diacylglucosamine diphosphatase LpxI [Hyphomicrobiaceae bacterium]
MPAATRPALGILAGGGALPIEIADAVARSGRPLHIVGIEGEADPAIARHPHTWVNLGGIGAMTRALRAHGCRELVIAGSARRPNLMKLRPDLGFLTSLPDLVRCLWGGDDSVLRRVVRFFEGKGLKVLGIEDVAPHLLAPPGLLGSHAPGEAQSTGIARAFAMIRALGPFDVGQAVVAAGDRIVAIEGAGGTDAMLDGIATHVKGGVLAKGPKPGQEMRVDVPTIGPDTVLKCARLGLAGIAVRQGGTIVLAREEVRRRADREGLFVIGVDVPEAAIAASPAAAVIETRPRDLTILGHKCPSAEDWKDIALGRRLLAALKAEGAGYSAVIARRYVLAVEGEEPSAEVVRRAAKLRPWGGRLARRRAGVVVVRDQPYGPWGLDGYAPSGPVLEDRLFHLAREAGMAGIACTEGPLPFGLAADAARRADAAGIFLVAPRTAP